MLYNDLESQVNIGSGTVRYIAFGTGQRPLILIPGLSLRSIHGSALPLAWSYRRFAKLWRVYVFDKTEPVLPGCTVADLAEDTAAAMDALGLAGADVVGVSMGGMIAQELAIRHPALVRKLVLGVTLSRPNETVRTAIGDWITMARTGDSNAIVRDFTERLYSQRYVRRYRLLLPLLAKLQKLDAPERFITLAGACLSCNTYDRLDQIRCPTLVLGGSKDAIATAEASRELAEKLGCGIHIYEDLGHASYEEASDFNDRIITFLNK